MIQRTVFYFLALVCMIIFFSCTNDDLNAPEVSKISSKEFSFDGKILTISKDVTVFSSDLQSSTAFAKGSSGEKKLFLDELNVNGNFVIDEPLSIVTKTLKLVGKMRVGESVYIKADLVKGRGTIDASAGVRQTLASIKNGSFFKSTSGEGGFPSGGYSDQHGGNGQTGSSGQAGSNGEFTGYNNNTNGGNGTDAGNGTNGANGGNVYMDLGVVTDQVTIYTYGGNGGNGGAGGAGGAGGNSDYYLYQRGYPYPFNYVDYYMYNFHFTNYNNLDPSPVVAVPAFNGGNGGRGGNGGNGGRGGNVTVVYDNITTGNFTIDAHGGNSGVGGLGGAAGSKGTGLTMTLTSNHVLLGDANWRTNSTGTAPDGLSGNVGPNGAGGSPGAAGTVSLSLRH